MLKALSKHFYSGSETYVLAFGRALKDKALHSPNLSVCGRSGMLKALLKQFYFGSETYVLAFRRALKDKALHRSNLSGQKLFAGSFLCFSFATGLINRPRNVIYAMNDNYPEIEEPSGFLKDDLHTFWSLARKFQLPVVLLITVFLGWRNPLALVINIVLLLLCTRPNPFSIYMFVEQLRQRDMRQNPSLQKAKCLYLKKVVVKDYKILCIARVELRDLKMDVVGILGGWWVFQTWPSAGRRTS